MKREHLPRVAVVLLLLAYVINVPLAWRGKTATYDETSELPAGLTYWRFHDFRMNFGHPPLVKLLAALLLELAGVKAPPLDDPGPLSGDPTRDIQYAYGHRLLFATPGNDADRILRLGRLPMLLFPLGLGVLLWCWGRELFGETVATLVVAFFALDPNMMAHGGLVKDDLPLTCLVTGSAYFLWRCLRQVTPGNLLGVAGFAAAAMTCKYNAPLLLACIGVAVLARALDRRPWPMRVAGRAREATGRLPRLGFAAVVLATAGLLSWAALWQVYGWRFDPTPDPALHFPVASLAERGVAHGERDGNVAKLAAATVYGFLDRHRLVPETVLFGFVANFGDAGNHRGFLCGHSKQGGWWYYFPFAILVKTPIPTLAALLLGLVVLATRRSAQLLRSHVPAGAWCLALPPLAFLGAGMASPLNIGLRHVLPVYPFIYLACGLGAAWLLARLWGRVALVGLAGWLVWGAVVTYPNYLTYFNEAAGGPAGGRRLLTDSNIDWGQDLPLLARWMREHGVRRVNLAYIGTADPTYYGIDYVCLPSGSSCPGGPRSPELPGYVAISATTLSGVYLSDEERAFYRRLLDGAVHETTLGNSILVYYCATPLTGPPAHG